MHTYRLAGRPTDCIQAIRWEVLTNVSAVLSRLSLCCRHWSNATPMLQLVCFSEKFIHSFYWFYSINSTVAATMLPAGVLLHWCACWTIIIEIELLVINFLNELICGRTCDQCRLFQIWVACGRVAGSIDDERDMILSFGLLVSYSIGEKVIMSYLYLFRSNYLETFKKLKSTKMENTQVGQYPLFHLNYHLTTATFLSSGIKWVIPLNNLT